MTLSAVRFCVAMFLAMASASSATVISKPTTDQVLSWQNIGEAPGMLRETNETIEATKFHFYRHKTRLSLKLLDTVIPRLESIQRNLSHLLAMSQDSTLTFASYKQSQDTLDKELSSVENTMNNGRVQNQEYFRAYKNLEDQLTAIHETLLDSIILFPDVQENFGNNDVDKIIEPIQTTFPPTEVTITSTEILITTPPAYIIVYAYNNFGSPSEMFQIHSECVTLPSVWHKRISSVNTTGNCVEICPIQDCQRDCMKLVTGSAGHNRLRDINFDKRMKSFRLC